MYTLRGVNVRFGDCFGSFQEAKARAEAYGFESVIEDSEGKIIATFSPIGGWKEKK
jgi:hypothetical protein